MNKLMIAGVAGALLAGGAAMADEPMKLTNGQMDDVTAGWRFAGSLGFTGGAFAGNLGTGGAGAFEETTNTTIDQGGLEFVPGSAGGLILFSTLGARSVSKVDTAYAGAFGGASGSGGSFSLAVIGSN